MDTTLFNLLLSLITAVIALGGGYLISFLKHKIGSENISNYYKIAKQIVMAIEQSNPQLAGVDKKDLALKKLIELSNNKISQEQADILIEAAIYDIKKLLSSN